MPRTILDFIDNVEKPRKKKLDIGKFIELCCCIALTSAEAFFEIYDMIEKSNDKKLKNEAHRLYGKTVIEIATMLNELQKLESKLRSKA